MASLDTDLRAAASDPARSAALDSELRALSDALLTGMATIRRSARLLARRPLELSTLTGSQVDLVRLVRRRPGISVAGAAEELRLAPNTVSTLVRQLTDAGLITRTPDDHDRRVARLELTVDMRRKVDAFRDRRVGALAAAMARLPASDRDQLAGAVSLLAELGARLPLQEHVDD